MEIILFLICQQVNIITLFRIQEILIKFNQFKNNITNTLVMNKTCLLYDGSFKGLITAVYFILDRNLSEVTILKKGKHISSGEYSQLEVETRELCVADIRGMVRLKAGEEHWQLIFRAFLSELKGAEDCILEFIQLVAGSEYFNMTNESHSCIRNIRHAAAMVERAEERIFEQVKKRLENDKEKWIDLRPPFDLLPVLASRLTTEFSGKRWVLWDSKRNSGWCFNGEFLEPVRDPGIPAPVLGKAFSLTGLIAGR